MAQAHAAAALLNFANNAHQKILAGYLEDVLLVLGNLLENGETKAQEQALSAIAAMAECAGENFEPFYNDFMPILKQILSAAGGDEYRVLRGKSMEVRCSGLGMSRFVAVRGVWLRGGVFSPLTPLPLFPLFFLSPLLYPFSASIDRRFR